MPKATKGTAEVMKSLRHQQRRSGSGRSGAFGEGKMWEILAFGKIYISSYVEVDVGSLQLLYHGLSSVR